MRWRFNRSTPSFTAAFFVAFVLASAGPLNAQTVFEVPDGDGAGLRAALEQAAADGGSSVVRLAANGSYFVDSNISLESDGQAAEIRLVGRRSAIELRPSSSAVGVSAGFSVREGVELTIEDSEFTFAAGEDVFVAGFSILGRLELDRGSLTRSQVENNLFDVGDGGALSASNLTSASNTLINSFGGFGTYEAVGLVRSEAGAEVDLRHITHVQNQDSFGDTVPLVDQGPFGAQSSPIRLANSIVEGACAEPEIDSLGGNWFVADDCPYASDADFVGPGDLNPVESINFSIPIVTLSPDAPAIDLGVDAYCARSDARGEWRRAPCDAGAFEDRPFRLALTDGGWNGLWKNQESNGHYLNVMQNLQGRVVLFWSTFDYDGNPAWIYAVGTVGADNVIRGGAYVNEGGVMTPAGVPLGQEAEPWGTFEVDFSDCFNGMFRYQTDDPAFPPQGEFTLDRLSRVQNLGCSTENESP